MSVKIAVTDGASCASCSKVVVLRPMGNIRRPSCITMPSPRLTFRPFRMPATTAAQSSGDRSLSWSRTGWPDQRLAVELEQPRPRSGLMKASRPIASTVSTPERMLRRMSSASRRTR